MSEAASPELKAKREYSQLLRLHERTLLQLTRLRDDLTSSVTVELVRI